jgi:hypothetical protein
MQKTANIGHPLPIAHSYNHTETVNTTEKPQLICSGNTQDILKYPACKQLNGILKLLQFSNSDVPSHESASFIIQEKVHSNKFCISIKKWPTIASLAQIELK